MRWFSHLPLAVQMTAVGALAMMVPAAHAVSRDDLVTARAFFYAGCLLLVATGCTALAVAGRHRGDAARGQLLGILYTFTLLPLVLAVPFAEALGDTRLTNAWFEMVSAITTTGATLYDPARLPDSLHLWRALVGWLGGLFVLISALAILAPMRLGGFEILIAAPERGQRAVRGGDPGIVAASAARRLAQQLRVVAPIYAGLTVALWVGLLAAGEVPFVALCHAMAVLSTSAISPVGGLANGASGRMGEVLVASFLLFALCRRTLPLGRQIARAGHLWAEPEVRLGLGAVVGVAVMILLLHIAGALRGGTPPTFSESWRTLWGALFTALSFLTTTGFVSADWDAARVWSGLQTPRLVLMGLAIVGGGVATVAGGVKILRIYALALHGLREMEKILHPHSVGGQGPLRRHLRSDGAFVAWIFFMLFALSIAGVVALLALRGLEVETALTFAISALTTTGPLAQVGGVVPLSYETLDGVSKAVLAGAMVVGRMETLALIALLAPDTWRQ